MSVAGWQAHAIMSLTAHWSPPFRFFIFEDDRTAVWCAVCADGAVITAPDAVLLRLRVRDYYDAHQAALKKVTACDELPATLTVVPNEGPAPVTFPSSFVAKLVRHMWQHEPEAS